MQMTGIIPEPVDQYTWANPGYGRKRLYPLSTAQALEEMRELFDIVLIDADMRLVENILMYYPPVAPKENTKRNYENDNCT